MATHSAKHLIICNASAGSGKTYALVKEYLNIVLRNQNKDTFRRILAMTFTNKAANEMKSRIIRALTDLSTSSDKMLVRQQKFLSEISGDFKLSEQIVSERAAKILRLILHNYDSFHVMTIDKFTHRVIRSFARDLGLSMDFDVELDLKKLQVRMTDQLFREIGVQQDITRLMVHYATSQLEQEKSWDFSTSIVEFSQILFKENSFQPLAKLQKTTSTDFIEERKKRVAFNRAFEATVQQEGATAAELIAQGGLVSSDFVGLTRGIANYFARLGSGVVVPPSDTVKNQSQMDEWGHKDSANRSAANALTEKLKVHFSNIEQLFDDKYSIYKMNFEILKNLNNLSLLNHLSQIVTNIKEEDNILLISDFYRRISEIISAEPVPYIYEKLGNRYEHFLLDEFQDTSRLQWINLVPLLENSLSSGQENFIVGDGKQAIYRWRNGVVEQFARLPKEMYNPENNPVLVRARSKFIDEGKAVVLKENYRSAEEIVQFNNAFFAYAGEQLPESAKYIYRDVSQEAVHGPGGYVELNLSDELAEETQLNYIVSCIERAREQGFEYSDICILVRSKKIGSKIAQHLSSLSLQLVSEDSLLMGRDGYVRFIIQLLKHFRSPADPSTKIKTLELFSSFVLNREPTEFILETREIASNDILEIFNQSGFKIRRGLGMGHYFNLYEMISRLLADFGLPVKENPYLQALLESAQNFTVKAGLGLRDYLEWYDEIGAETAIALPQSNAAIRIMTIHKSKGLEFPIVICPFLNWQMELNKQAAWLEEDGNTLPAYYLNMTKSLAETQHKAVFELEQAQFELDHLNMLYVAFTRAARGLFICGKNTHVNSPVKLWLMPFLDSNTVLEKKGDLFSIGQFSGFDKEAQPKVAGMDVAFDMQTQERPVLNFKRDERTESKRDFGISLHRVLSRLRSESDVDAELSADLKKGFMSEEDSAKLKEKIFGLFSQPEFLSYFNGKGQVYTEKPILDPTGKSSIPDRIILREVDTLVVDFKTGKEKDEHQTQVKKYIALLREMGYPLVRGEIFYTESMKKVDLG